MVSFEFLAIILTGLGLIVSLVYYASVLNNQTKARQRELVLQKQSLYSLEYSNAFAEIRKYREWQNVEEFRQKYGPDTNPKAWANWLYILRIFNLAGVLLQEKYHTLQEFPLFAVRKGNFLLKKNLLKQVFCLFHHILLYSSFQ